MMDMLLQAVLSLSAFPLSVIAKATVVIVAAMIAGRWVRRVPASMRHLILACAFAVLLVLPVAEFLLPSMSLAVRGGVAPRPAVLPITIADTAVSAAPQRKAPAVPADVAAPVAAALSLRALLLMVWAIGALVALVPVLLTPARLRHLRCAARRWDGGEAVIGAVAREGRRVDLLVHPDIPAPLTCGVGRPAIMLPADARQWSTDEIERALVHELEHIRRGDWPVHLATRAICALYWFHPLVWIAWRRLGLEAERACDDAVLRVAERTAYAQQLVALARRHALRSAVPVLSMASRSDLSARVAALLDDGQPRGHMGLPRASVVVVAAALLTVVVAPLRAVQSGQAPQGQVVGGPAFDVVSIRENKSGDLAQGMRRQPGGRLVVNNAPVRTLILQAFGLQPQQLVGGPDWIGSARYDIAARAAGEFPVTEPGTVGPMQLMMQRMLADRFQLAVHMETRELPIYALTVARTDGRLGPRLKPAATDCQTLMNELVKGARSGGAPPAAPQLPDGRPACGMRVGGGGALTAGGTSMAALARMLAVPVGRLVEDRTGLPGAFDFDLEFTADPGGAAAAGAGAPRPPDNANAPSIFTALEEQLGLKLEPQRAPAEVLVIDRIERPSEN